MPYKPKKSKLREDEKLNSFKNFIRNTKFNHTNEQISINIGNCGIGESSETFSQESIGGGVVLHGNGSVTILSGGATSVRTGVVSFGFSAISNIFADSDDS